ncbi:MarR family winged helix-turn-helix transcriptional regulator [Advenella mimigardefordensis]|uniref:Transcriptional regulator, MarR family n=1 Tax=Advenella mimigardefordensis (strain DSM 17166 / LMG 22922 / DPN7) TaxID=1247726 RepID=W0PG97_ADVMD|nr:MarR family winged helix-turn-helix transcriptional regulator [Advenella mimigardefordensis]AHG64587.1 transcriptional regulator, MarR family [Advenella mimigardefordensis DPN7]
MPSEKNVQDTHISEQMKSLHGSLISIVSALNRPKNDEKMIEDAGIRLDRALFTVLVMVERLGPIGVVDLADRSGRDYTTISRQVAKLESMELVRRQPNAQDRRVREAVIAPRGKAMTDRIDAARERMANVIFRDWPKDELEAFVKSMRKFADALDSDPLGGS